MFGETIKQRRLQKHLSQQELAVRLFVTRQTISNWENQKRYPDVPMLIKISQELDISLDYLLKEDEVVKKIEKDYQKIANQKKLQRANKISIICLVWIILVAIIGPILISENSWIQSKLFLLLIFVSCLVLLGSSYWIYKNYFLSDPRAEKGQPLFIPKMYGVGLSINPNHPLGKWLWVFITISVAGLFVWQLLS